MPCLLFVALVAAFVPRAAGAQGVAGEDEPSIEPGPITATVVREPYRTLEVVGLRRWTLEMLEDSIDRYAPGMSLMSHGCAATLRYDLGFAEAASFIINNPQGKRGRHFVVLLVEPQDSALVRHRDLPLDTAGTEAPWTPLVEWAGTQKRPLLEAVWARVQARGAGEPPTLPQGSVVDPAQARAIWSYLDAHAAQADAETARRVLRESRYVYDRVAAAAILSSFDEEDATWHALAGALLESDGAVRGFASNVLSAFASFRTRPVDWAPAAADVHAILNGGDLFHLHDFMGVLTKTGVGPALAAPLLRDGGHGALMLALVEFAPLREPALALLRALSGADHGTDIERWRAWIASL